VPKALGHLTNSSKVVGSGTTQLKTRLSQRAVFSEPFIDLLLLAIIAKSQNRVLSENKKDCPKFAFGITSF
jgi:hypothetical protein